MTQAISLITVTQPEAWQTTSGRFAGEWQGGASGANICVIANLIEEVGVGPLEMIDIHESGTFITE